MRARQGYMPLQDGGKGATHFIISMPDQDGARYVGCTKTVMCARVEQKQAIILDQAVLTWYGAIMDNRTICTTARNRLKAWRDKIRMRRTHRQ